MRRGRGAQLESVLEILTALQAARAGVTLVELAAYTDLHERTVRRYLQDVASRYFPIESVDGDDDQRRWRFVDGGAGRPVALGVAECLALGRLRPLALAATAGLPWRRALEQLFGRIEAAVPRPLREDVARMAETLGAAPVHAHARVDSDIYICFEEAVRMRRALAVRYWSLGGRAQPRRFDPYLVYVAEGAAYAYGHDHRHGEPRILAIDRVEAVLPLSASFERPAGFSPQSFVDGLYRGFRRGRAVEVALRLTGRAARLWAERPEVLGQVTEPLAGGSVRVRFSAPDTPALRARLLSFGAELEVEGPQRLREGVAGEIDQAAAVYRRQHRRREGLRVAKRVDARGEARGHAKASGAPRRRSPLPG